MWILLGLLLLLLRDTPVYAQTNTPVVIMTTHGFKPDTLTIDQGQTITFTNMDTVAHWPASDIHPSHGIYPAFDPKKPVEKGESWSFKFEQAGRWTFHDHLFPEHIGLVTVKATGKNAKAPFVDLQQISKIFSTLVTSIRLDGIKLYYRLFPQKLTQTLAQTNMHQIAQSEEKTREWLEVLGDKKVMEELIADSGGGSLVDCHQEAHRIGRIAFTLFGASVFRTGNFSCHSGFYHGAMEAFLTKTGTANLAQDIDALCKTFPTQFGLFECLHGVGHGVMAYLSYNLPKALEECKKLSGYYAQSSCFGGVFMENIVTAEGKGAGSSHQTWWVNADPLFPCNSVDQTYDVQYQCYLMQTSRMLDISQYDFSFVQKNCLQAPGEMIPVCFKSMGRDIAGQTLRDPQKIIEKCTQVPQQYFNICIEGALNVVIEFWGESLTSQPQALCNLLQTDSDRNQCFAHFGKRLPEIFGKDVETINNRCLLSNSYQKTCADAAGISH